MKNARSFTVDVLRGLILIWMFLNHLVRFFSLTTPALQYVYGSLGVFTTAELFLIISAYSVVSMSTNNVGEIYEWRNLAESAKKRFVKLYLSHMCILMVVVLMSAFSVWNLNAFNDTTLNLPLKRLLFGSAFLLQPVILDILPMYLAFAILNPFLLTWIKKYGSFMVVGYSLLIWMTLQFFDVFKHERYNQYVVYPHFLIFAWQFLYVSAIFLFLNKKSILKYRKAILTISFSICVFFFIFKHWIYSGALERDALTSITDMGILRFANVMCFASFCLALNLDLQHNFISTFLSWVGRNALALFCMHAICFYFHVFFTLDISKNWDLNRQIYLCATLFILPIFLLSTVKVFWAKWNEH